MSVLSPPHHLYVERALRLSRAWCAGRVIDDAPALRHAVLVARTLVRHVPDVGPELVAAALLHDAEEFAPENILLDAVLHFGVAEGVAPIVRALAAQHRSMDAGDPPHLHDPRVTLVAAADKIVAFRSLVTRASRAPDQAEFWAHRSAVRGLLPYFRVWSQAAQAFVPQAMAADLAGRLDTLEQAMERHLPQAPDYQAVKRSDGSACATSIQTAPQRLLPSTLVNP